MKTFRVPELSKDQRPSYLIMVLDGTFSMSGEYDLMIQAYKTVFEEQIKSEQVYAIQFGKEIGDIEPFFGAGSGDFNQAFEKILDKLNEDIKADITICVVSDGYENSDIKALKQQIDVAKQNHQIQFTSIAVGSGYPFELFQEFRNHFHNGAMSCTNVQFVERCNFSLQDSEQESEEDSQEEEKDYDKLECLGNFIKAFEIVRSQLTQRKQVEIDQQVWESITAQPQYFALENVVVASKAQKLTTKQRIEIQETRKAADVAEFIQTSCQQLITTQSNQNFLNVSEKAIQIKQISEDLFSRVDQASTQNEEITKKVIQQIEKDITILEEIGNGKLDLKNMSEADKTQLLSDFNPQKAEIQEARQLEYKQKEQSQESKAENKLLSIYIAIFLSYLILEMLSKINEKII